MDLSSIPDWLQGIGALIGIPIGLAALWQGKTNRDSIRKMQVRVESPNFNAPASIGGKGGDGHFAGQGGSGGEIVSGTFHVDDVPKELKIHVGRGGRSLPSSDGEDGEDSYIEGLPVQLRARGGKGGETATPEGTFGSLVAKTVTDATYCTNYWYLPSGNVLILSFGSEFHGVADEPLVAGVEATIALDMNLAAKLRNHLDELLSSRSIDSSNAVENNLNST